LWFPPVKPLRDQHYEGIDIKAEGGQVVAPPSIHPKTHRPYKFLWKPGDDIPELNLDNLVFPLERKITSKQAREDRIVEIAMVSMMQANAGTSTSRTSQTG
jgi:hypothetical protein